MGASPVAGWPTSGPEGRFTVRKQYCMTRVPLPPALRARRFCSGCFGDSRKSRSIVPGRESIGPAPGSILLAGFGSLRTQNSAGSIDPGARSIGFWPGSIDQLLLGFIQSDQSGKSSDRHLGHSRCLIRVPAARRAGPAKFVSRCIQKMGRGHARPSVNAIGGVSTLPKQSIVNRAVELIFPDWSLRRFPEEPIYSSGPGIYRPGPRI